MKKLFAIIMSVLMIACFMPTMAFAADGNVARYNNTEYATLQAAIDASKEAKEQNVVIDLLSDATMDIAPWEEKSLTAEGTETLTINGNTHTLAFNHTNSDWNHVYTNGATLILNNMTLTHTGYGVASGVWNNHDINFACDVKMTGVTSNNALAFKAAADLTNVKITDSVQASVYLIWIVPNGQTISLKNCEIDGTTASDGRCIKVDDQYQQTGENKKIKLNVTETTFKSNSEKPAIYLNTPAGADVTLENIDIANVKADSENAVWLDTNSKSNSNEVSIKGGQIKDMQMVASIDGMQYASLQAALETATDGQTVRLIETITLTDNLILDSGKKIQLDLNGKTINIPAQNYALITHGGIDAVGTGIIESKNESYAFKLVGSKTDVSDYSTLTIGNNVTVKSKGYGAFVSPYVNKEDGIHNYGTKIIIKGTVESNYGIYVNGQLKETEGNVPVVNLESGSKLKNAGIYAAGYANWNLAGDIEAPDALSIKSGNIVITGGKYTSTGDFYDPADANGNGSENTGAALSITSNDGYAKKLNVEVLGGEFTSINGYAIYEGIAFDKKKNESAAEESFATLAIKGGKFVGNQAKGSVAITTAKNTKVITGGTFSSDPSAYVAENYVATKSGETWTVKAKSTSGGGGGGGFVVIPTETPLDKAKTEANTAISAAASANKYDEAEQAEVKAILDKAAADIKNAKTEEEVKAIREAAQAEIDKVLTAEEKAQIKAVKGVDKEIFKAKSKYSKLKGKRAIKVTWNVPNGMKFDGFEVYRSTKKFSGYGKTPYFTTTKTSYINNKGLVKGKTYYYKVRAFVIINGEKVYTDYSTKAFRKIK